MTRQWLWHSLLPYARKLQWFVKCKAMAKHLRKPWCFAWRVVRPALVQQMIWSSRSSSKTSVTSCFEDLWLQNGQIKCWISQFCTLWRVFYLQILGDSVLIKGNTTIRERVRRAAAFLASCSESLGSEGSGKHQFWGGTRKCRAVSGSKICSKTSRRKMSERRNKAAGEPKSKTAHSTRCLKDLVVWAAVLCAKST